VITVADKNDCSVRGSRHTLRASSMHTRMLLSAGFVFHTVLGSFCMIPMAYANESLLPHEDHEEVMMTLMTPIVPVHCTDCSISELHAEHSPPMTPLCAGHCLAQEKDAVMDALILSSLQVQSPLTTVQPIAWKLKFDSPQSFAARPPDAISTRMIVLRV